MAWMTVYQIKRLSDGECAVSLFTKEQATAMADKLAKLYSARYFVHMKTKTDKLKMIYTTPEVTA